MLIEQRFTNTTPSDTGPGAVPLMDGESTTVLVLWFWVKKPGEDDPAVATSPRRPSARFDRDN